MLPTYGVIFAVGKHQMFEVNNFERSYCTGLYLYFYVNHDFLTCFQPFPCIFPAFSLDFSKFPPMGTLPAAPFQGAARGRGRGDPGAAAEVGAGVPQVFRWENPWENPWENLENWW